MTAPCCYTTTQTGEVFVISFLVNNYLSIYLNIIRKQLNFPVNCSNSDAVGIIGAVAKDFFNSTIKMEIVNQIEEVERMGKKEHIVFLITQSPAFIGKVCTENRYICNIMRL